MKMMMRASVTFMAALSMSMAFPTYDDPQVASPDLIRPGSLLCSIDLITNAVCDGYDKVITQPYTPPNGKNCAGYVSKVILDFHGSVKGVQFDRYGTLFLGPIELLRTTTPEPSPKGIHWHIEKDVSDYLLWFLDTDQEKAATLSIPNTVDDTYTGAIHINATLSFYGHPLQSSSSSAAAVVSPALRGGGGSNNVQQTRVVLPDPHALPPLVYPLANAPAYELGLWKAMAISGNATMTTPLPWPQSNIARAYVDVFASPHECEEFWYTNYPDDMVHQLGGCGGGSYREVLVYINGHLAGATYPFIVLYTGGINPFLWRPLTGIESFDIAAYRIDLAPFVGMLNTASSSSTEARPNITLAVHGNNGEGLWYMSGNLLLYPDADITDPTTILAGEVTLHNDSGPISHVHTHGFAAAAAQEQERRDENGSLLSSEEAEQEQQEGEGGGHVRQYMKNGCYSIKTFGHHTYLITGNLIYPNGSFVTTTVASEMSSVNDNQMAGENRQKTQGLMVSKSVIESHRYDAQEKDGRGHLLGMIKREDQYPFTIDSYYAADNDTMELRAVIDISLKRTYETLVHPHHHQHSSSSIPAISKDVNNTISVRADRPHHHEGEARPSTFMSAWVDQIKSAAIYNRSLDHTTTHKMADISTQTFRIETSSAQIPCYHHHMVASGGSIVQDRSDYTCVFPAGLSFCSYQLCNQLVYDLQEQEQAILDHPPVAGAVSLTSTTQKEHDKKKSVDREKKEAVLPRPEKLLDALPWSYDAPMLRLDVIAAERERLGLSTHDEESVASKEQHGEEGTLLVRSSLMDKLGGGRGR